jgi:hypothetical protein
MRAEHHGIGEYIRLLYLLFTFIAGVWILRMILYVAGAPVSITHLVSVTVASGVSSLLAVLLINYRRFGSYGSVVVASLFINIWAELLISVAILFTMFSGKTNVYSAPEYSGMRSLAEHLRGNLTFGIVIGTLNSAAVGCLLLWLLRTMVPQKDINIPGTGTGEDRDDKNTSGTSGHGLLL